MVALLILTMIIVCLTIDYNIQTHEIKESEIGYYPDLGLCMCDGGTLYFEDERED